MAAKKDNLPLSMDNDTGSASTITYANEVIAIISGVAANEVEGIAGMCTSGGINGVFGHNRNITKGVKVEIGSEEASVDLYVIVEYGTPIQKAAADVQENVRKAIETMTGLHVVRVDVHVQGVSFDKENKELQAGIESLTESDAVSREAAKKQDKADSEESAAAQEAQDNQSAMEAEAAEQAQDEAQAEAEYVVTESDEDSEKGE